MLIEENQRILEDLTLQRSQSNISDETDVNDFDYIKQIDEEELEIKLMA